MFYAVLPKKGRLRSGGDLRKVQHQVQIVKDINAHDHSGATPMHVAASNGFDFIVRELLARQATATVSDAAGETPLHMASGAGHAEVVACLLGSKNTKDNVAAKGALVNARDAQGRTATMLAVRGHHLDLAAALIRTYGADANIADATGFTPFLLAAHTGDLGAMQTLAAAGASLDGPRLLSTGGTPLHVAAAAGQDGAVGWLLRAGAKTSSVDNQALTPQEVARANGHTGVYQRLREASLGGAPPGDRASAMSPSVAGPSYSSLPELGPSFIGGSRPVSFAGAGPPQQGFPPQQQGHEQQGFPQQQQAGGRPSDSFLASAQRAAEQPAVLYPAPPA
ncbi:hypothetical protein FOA52_000030 [Chlamydomonas sp. UWO 241]|nr:hypothetical protein FOA52_000030 [Chlamydomonas sp. UWO 241]